MKKILLIEDDPFIIDIYTTKLKEEGFEVDVATNGEKALEKIKEKPDLILLDIVLPGMDGWEILREIKKRKELKSIPVVVLSNLSQKSEVEKSVKLGATKYLIKANYTPSQVVEQIKECLKK
jgi:two-component system alkaline phosphatase synthesis response regulator PhoP